MNFRMNISISIWITVFIATLTSSTAIAGKLKDFGSSATKAPSSSSSSSNRSSTRSQPTRNSRAETRSPSRNRPSSTPSRSTPASNSRSSGGGKLRDFGKAATSRDTERRPPTPTNNGSNSGSNNGHTGGSSNNSRGGHDPHHHRRHHHRRYHDRFSNRFYCRRPTLFDDLYFDNYNDSRCRVPQTIIIQQRTESASIDATHNTEEQPAKAQILPFESVRSSRMLEPSIRADLSIGELESSIEMQDYRFEIGFNAISLSFQHSNLIENYIENGTDFTDKITIDKVMLNYRVRIADQFAMQIGLGSYDFRLANTFDLSTSAMQFMGKWHAPSGFGIEYLYALTLGNEVDIEENEISIFHGYENFSLRAGYRQLKADGLSLNGPFLGISMHF